MRIAIKANKIIDGISDNIVKDKAKILYCINYPTISSSLKKKLISFSAFTFESDP